MKKVCWFTICWFALLAAGFAATSKEVSYQGGDETVKGILFTPAGKGPFPAIVVIHEYWGLNDWVKEQATKLAEPGYVALAIDLFRGKVADKSADLKIYPDAGHAFENPNN